MRHSEREALNHCPERYRLSKIEGLRKQVYDHTIHHARHGIAMHAALAKHYTHAPFTDVCEAFLNEYPTSLSPDDLAKTPENSIKALAQYISYYQEQDKNWRVLEIEQERQIDIDGEEHDLHIDLIAENLQGGGIYFWDHKIVGRAPSSSTWKGYDLSAQLTRYTEYVLQKYGQCSGAIINNITIGHRERKYKGEPAGFWCRFERHIFNRTPAQIGYWRESEKAWMKSLEFYKTQDVWPKSLNKMCAYCEFYELCLSSGDEEVKNALYKPQNYPEIVVED